MLTLLVPMLVSYFNEDDKPNECFGKFSNKLHDYALQRLMKIGPQYPSDFRTVMQSCPELKLRLEGAVKASQLRHTNTSAESAADLAAAKLAASQPTQPSIKLKMDFSNFGQKS
jgi:hypothetical protein